MADIHPGTWEAHCRRHHRQGEAETGSADPAPAYSAACFAAAASNTASNAA